MGTTEVIGDFFSHRAAAAFFAIIFRFRSDSEAARANPPLDAPSFESATAARFFTRSGSFASNGDPSIFSPIRSSTTDRASRFGSRGFLGLLAREGMTIALHIFGVVSRMAVVYRRCQPERRAEIKFYWLPLLLQVAMISVSGMNGQTTLSVDATMDLYRAGGYDDGSDGAPPASYSFAARGGRTIVFSSITGRWTGEIGVPPVSADGGASPGLPQLISNPTGPFSGYALTDFEEALAGVFTQDSPPTVAPPQLTFSLNASDGGIPIDFKTLSPRIGQIFFIGDGLTGSGTGNHQVFLIPKQATHLYMGFVDSCSRPGPAPPGCYSDNAGTLTAKFAIYESAQ